MGSLSKARKFVTHALFPVIAMTGLCQGAQASVIPTVLSDGVTVIDTVNIEDDSGLLNDSNWFIFHATSGASVDVDINRLVAAPDLCAELYFGDVTGVMFGGLNADCGAANGEPPLVLTDVQDDTEDDAFGGSFGDPRFTFVAADTGIYSLQVHTLNSSGVGSEFEVIATGIDPINTVAEPSMLLLLGSGLIGLAGVRRKRA